MAGINRGDRVGSLVCVDANIPEKSNLVRMRCDVCGRIGLYDKYATVDYKEPCRFCRFIGKYKMGFVENNNELIGYNTRSCASSHFGSLADTKDIDDYKEHVKFMFRCRDCGESTYYLRDQIPNPVKCPHCGNKAETVKKEDTGRIKIDGHANKLRPNVNYIRPIGNVRIEDTSDSMVGKTFGTLKVLSVLKDKDPSGKVRDIQRVNCQCTECNTKGEYSKTKVKNLTANCRTCKEMNTKLYKGQNDKLTDMTGVVINGLRVVGQTKNANGVVMCKYRCNICKKEGSTPMVKFIAKQEFCAYCNKMGPTSGKISWKCPECGMVTKISYNEFYNSNGLLKCKNRMYCRNEVSLPVERALEDEASTYRNTLRKYIGKGYGLQDVQSGTRLAVFGDVFINRDGERCYNCYCIEHRQELVLTEDEIASFKHEQCNSPDVEHYRLLNIPTILPKRDNKEKLKQD